MRKLPVVFLVLIGMLCSRRDGASQTIYKRTSVCHVLDLGTANRVLNVQLDAGVLSDGMHGAILTDTKCPGRGLYIGVIPDEADASVLELQKALWSDGAPGTTGRKVSGTFFGKLRLDHRTKKISLTVTRVEHLVNERTDGPPPADGVVHEAPSPGRGFSLERHPGRASGCGTSVGAVWALARPERKSALPTASG
jgi:hypothetical protein